MSHRSCANGYSLACLHISTAVRAVIGEKIALALKGSELHFYFSFREFGYELFVYRYFLLALHDGGSMTEQAEQEVAVNE